MSWKFKRVKFKVPFELFSIWSYFGFFKIIFMGFYCNKKTKKYFPADQAGSGLARPRPSQRPSLISRTEAESHSGMAQTRFAFFLFRTEKQIKIIINGLQKSRNKFSRAYKIKPHKVNIYLGPKCNFEKCTFFLNSNKIPKNSEIKSYLILLLNPKYFFILGKSFYSLSHIFVI